MASCTAESEQQSRSSAEVVGDVGRALGIQKVEISKCVEGGEDRIYLYEGTTVL